MERVLADRIPEFVETLAYHFLRGGVTDKAIYYLGEAGKKCVARYALAEATIHFRDAYALIAERERTAAESRVLAELLIAWSQVHYYDGTIGEWLRLLEKHRDDAERCGDPAVLALYLGWLGNVRAWHGDFRGSVTSIERALEIARSADARNAVAHALCWGVHTLVAVGRMADAIRSAEAFEQTEAEIRTDPYPYAKTRAGLILALAYSGHLRKARLVAQDLADSGRAGGNSRAEAMGRGGIAMYWLLSLDFERAAAFAQVGIDVAKDPAFRAWNALYLMTAFLADARYEAADPVIADYLPYLERNQNYWLGQSVRGCRAGVDLAAGQLSSGMRRALASTRSLQEVGNEGSAYFTEVFNMLTYVSTARRDMTPTFGALLRNPWFVFTQAPFAARTGRRMIDRLRAEAAQKDLRGFLGLIALGEGRLLAHQGKKAEAREVLERIRRFLEAAGVEHVPAPVAALAAEIDG